MPINNTPKLIVKARMRGRIVPRMVGKVNSVTISFSELQPSARVLLGPGPSNVHPRVMKAMLSPMVGHLDPDFIRVMEDVKKLLRIVFETANEITIPVSGT
ncbi:MAG TPA: hypothetical protein VJ718_01060, partial [Candidatus Binataceae bacterium]|nr:hypothetical protein [Candidatus Binataceae bacterium]